MPSCLGVKPGLKQSGRSIKPINHLAEGLQNIAAHPGHLLSTVEVTCIGPRNLSKGPGPGRKAVLLQVLDSTNSSWICTSTDCLLLSSSHIEVRVFGPPVKTLISGVLFHHRRLLLSACSRRYNTFTIHLIPDRQSADVQSAKLFNGG